MNRSESSSDVPRAAPEDAGPDVWKHRRRLVTNIVLITIGVSPIVRFIQRGQTTLIIMGSILYVGALLVATGGYMKAIRARHGDRLFWTGQAVLAAVVLSAAVYFDLLPDGWF